MPIARAFNDERRRTMVAVLEERLLQVQLQLLGLRLERASQAQRRRVSIIASVVESVRVTRRWSPAFFVCGLVPFSRDNLSRHYVRDVDEDPEMLQATGNPERRAVRGGKRAPAPPPVDEPERDLTTPVDQAFFIPSG